MLSGQIVHIFKKCVHDSPEVGWCGALKDGGPAYPGQKAPLDGGPNLSLSGVPKSVAGGLVFNAHRVPPSPPDC